MLSLFLEEKVSSAKSENRVLQYEFELSSLVLQEYLRSLVLTSVISYLVLVCSTDRHCLRQADTLTNRLVKVKC